MFDNKNIRNIIIVWFALGLFLIMSKILYKVPYTEEETPVEIVVNDYARLFKKHKSAFNQTVKVIRRVNRPTTVGISATASDTKESNYWLLSGKWKQVRINNQYPFFIKEMKKIWNGKMLNGTFNRQFISLSFCGKYHCLNLLHTEVTVDNFISSFRDSMEYCIYPQIPKSSEHWIVKLEDNWYLYDGHFPLEIE